MTGVRFDIETDRPLVRKESGTRYVLARIVAPEGKPRQRPPVNLALVLDRSGSMGGNKIRLAKEAAVAALRRLEPRDRFAVVFYDERIDVVAESTAASAQAVEAAARAIRDVGARGSTDLCGGWLRGCEQVGRAESSEAVSRALLLTDGLANAGVTDPSEIARHAAELRRRGVATTTIGVGEDFDEHLLGAMADEGGGNFYYVKHGDEISAAIENEVGEALEVTLRGATLRVGPASVAEVRPIRPLRTRREGADRVIDLGDLVSLQELTLPLRIDFAPGALSSASAPAVGLTFALGSAAGPASDAVIQWRIASAAEVAAQPRNRAVDRAVADAYASLALREAGRLNRDGQYDAARDRLAWTRARIQGYAGDDAFLNGLVRKLEGDAAEHGVRMSPSILKAGYANSYAALSSRTASGAARRAPRRDDSDGT
jgi:Ca-activated chloride channel family protein